MSESVSTELLSNCTYQAINHFPFTTEKNQSEIQNYNRTDILDLLSRMIDTYNKLYIDVDTGSTIK